MKHIIILIILSYIYFVLGNGIFSLSGPDEVFYAQTAKEMAGRQSWMTPYLFGQPQFEKPVFLYWLLRIGFVVFGENSFSSRFFPALFACLGVIGIYLLCLFAFGRGKKPLICGLILLSSGLYVGLARTVFTDMVFSVWILLALVSFYWGYVRQRHKGASIILFFIFSALAVLTKGPLGLIIPGGIIVLFLGISKDLKYLFNKYFLWAVCIFALVAFPWYILMINKYGNSFVSEFFYNDHIRRIFHAEHLENDTWYFYPLSIITGMLPWSLYVAPGMFFLFKRFRDRFNPLYVFLISWIGVVFLIFQPAHSKLASYIFPLFPALAVVCGDFICEQAARGKGSKTLFYISLSTAVSLAVFAAGLTVYSFVSPKMISMYTGSIIPVWVLAFLLSAQGVWFFSVVAGAGYIKAVYVLMLFLPIIFSVLPFTYKSIDPYLSSRDMCAYLLDNHAVDTAILCSKPFVRGVRYHTGKEVAVIDIPGRRKFFSLHPILFLDHDFSVLDFLRKQKTTYCILKKSSLLDIVRFPVEVKGFREEFRYDILKKIGNEYLVKIEPQTK